MSLLLEMKMKLAAGVNAERLLALYERIVAAPDAITRLRRFALELAVRGKLVELETERRLNCTRLAVGDVLIAGLPNPIDRACTFPDIGRPAVTAVDRRQGR